MLRTSLGARTRGAATSARTAQPDSECTASIAVTKVFGRLCRFARTVSSTVRCRSRLLSGRRTEVRLAEQHASLRGDVHGFGDADDDAHALLPQALSQQGFEQSDAVGARGRELSMDTMSTGPVGNFTSSTSFRMMLGRVATTSRATCSACCSSRMSGEIGAVVTSPLRLRYGRMVVDPVAVTSLVSVQRMKRRTGSPRRLRQRVLNLIDAPGRGHVRRAHLREHVHPLLARG